MPVEGLIFRSDQTVFDVIYNRDTTLLQAARAAGAKSTGGEGMFLYQGARAFEIWTGAPAPYEIMRKVLSQSLEKV